MNWLTRAPRRAASCSLNDSQLRRRRVLYSSRPVVDRYLMATTRSRLLVRPSDSFHFAAGHTAGVTWWNSPQARRRSTPVVSKDHTRTATVYVVRSSALNPSRTHLAPRRHRANALTPFFICLSRAGTILMRRTSTGPIARSADVFCLGPDAVS